MLHCRLPLTPFVQANMIGEMYVYIIYIYICIKVEHNFYEIPIAQLTVLGHHSYLLLTSLVILYVIRKFLDRDRSL